MAQSSRAALVAMVALVVSTADGSSARMPCDTVATRITDGRQEWPEILCLTAASLPSFLVFSELFPRYHAGPSLASAGRPHTPVFTTLLHLCPSG